MQIDLINCLLLESRDAFKHPRIQRGWDLLMLVEDGSCTVSCGGIKKPFTLGRGDIALLPANCEIYREVVSTLTFYQFAFYGETEHPFYRAAQSGKLALTREQREAIFQSVRRAYPRTGSRELMAQIIGYIFAENYLFGKSSQESLEQLSEEVSNTVQYLNRHLNDQIDMNALAARVYISHSALIWKFKQELGTTPSQYLIHLRLRNARHLLLTTNNSISEIAEICGYSNPYYFTNAFRRYAGRSPSDFRAYHLKNKK